MVKRILEFFRRRNRARLERRQLARAGGKPGGWLSRAVSRVRAKNHARLAHRRAQRNLLASLAANDTASLEALVFLLNASRQDRRTRADADEALAKRFGSLETRVDAGVRLLAARLQALETRLLASARADGAVTHAPAVAAARHSLSGGGVNGEAQRPKPQLNLGGQSQASGAEVSDPGDKAPRRS